MYIQFIPAVGTIVKKKPRPPIVEQIKKMWYIFTVEFYSAKKKKNKIMTFVRKIWKLENILLKKASMA